MLNKRCLRPPAWWPSPSTSSTTSRSERAAPRAASTWRWAPSRPWARRWSRCWSAASCPGGSWTPTSTPRRAHTPSTRSPRYCTPGPVHWGLVGPRLSCWTHLWCFLLDAVVGRWEDQPSEAAQPEGQHESAGRRLQTRWEPHHQHPVQDPADGHLRYLGSLSGRQKTTWWHLTDRERELRVTRSIVHLLISSVDIDWCWQSMNLLLMMSSWCLARCKYPDGVMKTNDRLLPPSPPSPLFLSSSFFFFFYIFFFLKLSLKKKNSPFRWQ